MTRIGSGTPALTQSTRPSEVSQASENPVDAGPAMPEALEPQGPGVQQATTAPVGTTPKAGGLSRSIRLLQGEALPQMSASQLRELSGQVHDAIEGLGTDEAQLFAALEQLTPEDAQAFRAMYAQSHGSDVLEDIGGEWFLSGAERTRAKAYIEGDRALGHAIGLHRAFDAGDGEAALALLKGGTAESLEGLKDTYREHYGRDLEYEMRGWARDRSPIDIRGLTPTLRGLKGEALKEAFGLLHTPRLENTASRIAALTAESPASTLEGRQEIYGLLSLAGGEERALLGEIFEQQTGRSLVETLKPVFEAGATDGSPPATDPDKTVAIVVSSGNWGKVASGESDAHIGGYHWREIEAYVEEALERGFTPVIFTPDGLPPSPDAASLLQGKFGPKLGFGLRAGTGPESEQGQAIMEGFAAPRSLRNFDASQFATIHVAGGHGSHHDLVGNPVVEQAATAIHERGQVVTGVCHASPALGKLLEGGPATSFSPQIDAIMVKAGYVLPEFHPPYDAHQGLVDLGVDFGLIDRGQSLLNIHHTERYDRPGRPPVITGTGPEATDNVARQAFDWLELQRAFDIDRRFGESGGVEEVGRISPLVNDAASFRPL